MFSILNKILLALVIVSVGYMLYGFVQIKNEMYGVFNVEPQYVISPKNADLMIMDFSRYECEHCRALHPILMQAIEEDGRISYAPRHPAFGFIWSETLAAATYAAQKQGKFLEMQNAIYKRWPVNKHERLFEVAQSIGLDVELLKKDMNDPMLRERMEMDTLYFKALRYKRTPTILIGRDMTYTFDGQELPSVEKLKEMFNLARQNERQ